ncbi:hypothetical protein MJD09_26895 [bacterium]|nr:hypothetical protein [bacterium]
MRKTIATIVTCLLVFAQISLAWSSVRIKSLAGEVKVRRGVEETWHPVSTGARLEEIDSILTGEAGEVVLELASGDDFHLGSNAILDVADLRKITEQDLFLLLMSRKIQKMEQREKKTKLRIGRVNVVHGELRTDSSRASTDVDDATWEKEKNGALALYGQNYTTNSILKLSNILARYPNLEDCGEVQLYLGRAYEKISKSGQALDAYRAVLKQRAANGCEGRESWLREAEGAVSRLNR